MTKKDITLSSTDTVNLKANWTEVIIVYTSNSWNTIAYIDNEGTIINPIYTYMRFTVSNINRNEGTLKLTSGSYSIYYY